MTTDVIAASLLTAVVAALLLRRAWVGPARRRSDPGRAVDREMADLRAQLAAARAEADAAALVKRDFLANLSHELRTPLGSIIGYADLLASPEASRQEREQFVRSIQANSRSLLATIDGLLDLARLEAGAVRAEIRDTHPLEVIDDVISRFRAAAEGKGLELRCQIATPVPERIRTDPDRLRHILMALVDNAVKFTERGRVVLRLELVGATGRCPAVLRFGVCDTGPGFDPAMAHAPTVLLRPGDATPSRRHGGLGSGLSRASRFAALLGAELEVVSIPGAGSTVTLGVPVGSLEGVAMRTTFRSSETPGAESPEDRPRALAGRRILFVEDGPDNRRLVSFYLQRAGAVVDTAEDGRRGHEAALAATGRGEPYDLVLMDMQMPEMDGYAATRLLRTEGLRTPIVALTAHAVDGERERCLAAGCNDYLAKPVDRDRLIRTAAKWSGSSLRTGAT